jgi:hypothetical protein
MSKTKELPRLRVRTITKKGFCGAKHKRYYGEWTEADGSIRALLNLSPDRESAKFLAGQFLHLERAGLLRQTVCRQDLPDMVIKEYEADLGVPVEKPTTFAVAELREQRPAGCWWEGKKVRETHEYYLDKRGGVICRQCGYRQADLPLQEKS